MMYFWTAILLCLNGGYEYFSMILSPYMHTQADTKGSKHRGYLLEPIYQWSHTALKETQPQQCALSACSIKSTQSNVQSGPMLTRRAQSGAAGQLFARVRVEGEVEALSFLLSAHRGSWVSACRRWRSRILTGIHNKTTMGLWLISSHLRWQEI